ncbi:MAG: SIR2 family protein [Thermoplasmata archaeon]
MTVLDALSAPDPSRYLEEAAGPIPFLFSGNKVSDTLGGFVHELGDEPSRMAYALRLFVRDRCRNPDFGRVNEVYDPLVRGLADAASSYGINSSSSSRGVNYPAFDCFTTNYDLAFEAYCRRLGMTINTGEVERDGYLSFSAYQARQSNPYLLLHLHGSINMVRLADGRVIRTEFIPEIRRTSGGEEIEGEVQLYPVLDKHLTRYPFPEMFSSFQERLSRAPLVVFVGFSFRDEPIIRSMRDLCPEDQDILLISRSAKDIGYRLASQLRATVMPIPCRLGDPELIELLRAAFKDLTSAR